MRTPRACAQLTVCLALGSFFTSACKGRALEEDLRMSIAGEEQAVSVDLSCEACAAEVVVDAYFDPDAYLNPDDEVVLEQFRVDYALEGVDDVPYLAGVLEQHVRPDDDASFTVLLAGSAQREHVGSESPDDDVEGRATLTLAGYDSDDEQVFVEQEIAIRFVHGSSVIEEPAP